MSDPTPHPSSLPALPERRVALRHRHTADTVCRVTAPDGAPPVPVLVWNISAAGVCLLFSEPRPVGTVLAGTLETSTGGGLPVAFRVIH